MNDLILDLFIGAVVQRVLERAATVAALSDSPQAAAVSIRAMTESCIGECNSKEEFEAPQIQIEKGEDKHEKGNTDVDFSSAIRDIGERTDSDGSCDESCESHRRKQDT